ncbi:MAG: TrkA family potassium uptake protein [Bacillota bacterium]|nr:TrkA family potassium uptake protein [Bacillota bacterium]
MIVCGAGEVGNIVIQQFKENNLKFLVIENSQERVEELKNEGVLTINDDATNEDTLIHAKIESAKGLVASLSNDADNVFTVLTARQLNPDIYIIAKAIEKNAYRKLEKAGADNTISPNEIGGRRIAAMVIRPSVISFLDVMTKADNVLIDLEEVKIGPNSDLIGKNLKEAKVPERSGLIVMAIRHKENNKINFNPSSKEVLNEGDVMIVLGKPEQVDLLKEIACDKTKSSII